MRINAQQRQPTVPFSDERGHFDIAFTRVWAPAKQLPDKANCRESMWITSISAIHRSIFLTILILKRIYSLSIVTPDHHFAQAV